MDAKVRAVVLGDREQQIEGEEIRATVPDFPHMRMALNIASNKSWAVGQQDVSTAFLNAQINKTVYVFPPILFQEFGFVLPNTVWKLRRAVYGLRSSPALWSKTRDEHLEGTEVLVDGRPCNLRVSSVDSGIFRLIDKESQKVTGLMIVYVDDVLTLGSVQAVKAMQAKVATIWSTKQQGILEQGAGPGGVTELIFLGVRITRGASGELLLDQSRWLLASLLELGWKHLTPTRGLPQLPQGEFAKEDQDNPCCPGDLHRAQSLIGTLQWLSLRTRPDICACTNILATAVSIAPARVVGLAKSVMRYVVGSLEMRLQCSLPSYLVGSDRTLEAYSDASWAPGGGLSRSGWCIMWNSSLVDYGSSKQKLVSLSSCEAELRAATDTGCTEMMH